VVDLDPRADTNSGLKTAVAPWWRKESEQRIAAVQFGLYYTYIKLVPHVTYKVIFRMLMHFKPDTIG
jgi:hypothetical protein